MSTQESCWLQTARQAKRPVSQFPLLENVSKYTTQSYLELQHLLNISEINVQLAKTKMLLFLTHSLESFPEISHFSYTADI